MKTYFHTLQHVLAFELQGLYDAEKKIKKELASSLQAVSSEALRLEIVKYIRNTDNKLRILERIFDYLMLEPDVRKNKVVVDLLEETREMLNNTDSPHLKDILTVSGLQNINAYIVSCLKIAYMFTVEQDLDSVSDLLQQFLESELETGRLLSALAIEEFNREYTLSARG